MLFWAMGGKVFSQSSEVRIVYDYLWVYPNELGTFTEYPSTLVSKLNEQKKYGCSTWRRPTEEELQILRANNLASNSSYFRDGDSWKSDYSKRVLLVTTKEEEMKQRKYDQAQAAKEAAVRRIEVAKENRKKFVDLGLPSGIKWQFDAGNKSLDDAKSAVTGWEKWVPRKENWDELSKYCTLKECSDKKGLILTGPNGTEVYMWPNDVFIANHYYTTKKYENGQIYQSHYYYYPSIDGQFHTKLYISCNSARCVYVKK